MGVCDLCGKETHLCIAEIEGTELNVCKPCGKFGKILAPSKKQVVFKKKIVKQPERIETLVSIYPQLIKDAREKKQLTQKDFALQLNEKESFIQKIETGKIEPSIETAKKLEQLLGIKLIEEVESAQIKHKKMNSQGLTIGDLIKLK